MKGKSLLFFLFLFFGILEFVTASAAGVVIHGKVMDSKTMQPVSGSVSIYLDSDYFKERMDLEYGEFKEALTDYGWYLIKISAKGYVEKTDTLWVLNDLRPDLKRDYYLTPQSISSVFASPIYFDRNKSALSSDAISELDNIVNFLNENPEMSCEINGHADKSGSQDVNLALSEDRAYSVFDYLLDKGIDRARLRTFGYGSAIPADSHESKDAMAKNRRVEVVPFQNNSDELFPVFDNVYFDFSKTELTQQYDKEFESIVSYLKDNPHAACEIAGHSDNVGSSTVNMLVSQKRAEAVVKYLTSQGIDGSRLKARGYGFSRPMDTNSTTVGRAKNRRVEFNIRAI